MQGDEHAIERGEFIKPTLGRIEGLRIDSARLQGSEDAAATHQRDFPLTREDPPKRTATLPESDIVKILDLFQHRARRDTEDAEKTRTLRSLRLGVLCVESVFSISLRLKP